ncbi:AfsA-related hotdog domain-containing protein [Streptomyces sp. NPDC051578]|uniref:AfsA-related hotdog domain-containing protein n=1 Tax=Streptomyces sp. NPDC051578 TaxID=3365662 RepID=UPI0037BB9F05
MTVDNGTTIDGRVLSGTRHLIHRPPSRAHYGLDVPSLGEENFTLVGATPVAHPLFNDGPAHFHDMQIATETMGEIGAFVGQRYYGVPEDRPGLFYRFTLNLTDLAAWRSEGSGAGPVPMATRIRARPANVVAEVPRGLDFHIEVSLDDRPCATGSAGLVFLMPRLYRRHVEHSRQALRAVPELDDAPDGPLRPAGAREVGRYAGENVVVSEPADASRGRISTWLLGAGVSPVFGGEDGRLSGLHVLEALRQASLLSAGRAHGLDARRSTLGGLQVHFRGQAEHGVPLRCVAVAGPLAQGVDGRPAVPVTLTLTQRRRAVAEARTSVVQDY